MEAFSRLPGFLELGGWTTGHVRPIFELFRDENVAPALAVTILGFALALCILFALNTTYIRLQVGRRSHAVRRVKDKTEFAGALPRIERLMLSSRYLRHSWQKFRETLIEPRNDEEAQTRWVIQNTARPQEYFNTVEAGLRFPLYRAMPNLLVGIGLLLTFFGLVTALYFTTDAIKNATDLAASQDALRNLLYAASFKFYTSVAGLGGSILLTLVIRYGTATVESAFNTLASSLETKLVFVTPESIAFDHYREAQEQTKNLRLFNTEVAISVGKRIEEALAATLPTFLAQAMAPIGKVLEDVASKITSVNEGAIGEMAGSFAEKLQGATGEQMRGIAEILVQLRTSLESTNDSLRQGGEELKNSVGRSTQEMREAVTSITESLKQAGGSFGAGLDGAAAKLEAASGRMTVQAEQAISTIRQELVEQGASMAQRIARAAAEAGEESRAKVADAGTEVANAIGGIGAQLTTAVTAIREGVAGAVREIENVERSIGQHVSAMNQLTKATKDAEDAMSRSAHSMRQAGEPLADSSRQIVESTRIMAEATAGAERSISEAQSEISNIARLLQAALEGTTEQWRDYEQRFKDADESLGAVLDRIVQSVNENLEALRSFVEQVDEKLAAAVDKLGGGIEDLGEFAQSMEQLTTRLNGGSGSRHATNP